MTPRVREFYIYGDSGGTRGFSGGPVISLSYPRGLIGMVLVGGAHPAVWNTADFLTRVLDYSVETPRLKIFVAAMAKGIHIMRINK